MPKINVTKSHQVPLEDAKARTRSLLEQFQAKNASIIDDVSWSPDGCVGTAKGSMFKGTFKVTPSQIVCDIDLSFMAAPFKGKVEAGLQKKLDELFA
jgi:hypothetical protein